MPRHERQRRHREQLHVALRVQREGDVGEQHDQMRTRRPAPAEGQPGDDREQRAEEELAVQDVEVGREELLGLLEQERLAEERDQVGEQPPAVGVERDPDDREQERERVVPRAVAPLRLPPADQPLEHVAREVEADQHQPVGEAAVQVGPEARRTGRYHQSERRSVRSTSSSSTTTSSRVTRCGRASQCEAPSSAAAMAVR